MSATPTVTVTAIYVPALGDAITPAEFKDVMEANVSDSATATAGYFEEEQHTYAEYLRDLRDHITALLGED